MTSMNSYLCGIILCNKIACNGSILHSFEKKSIKDAVEELNNIAETQLIDPDFREILLEKKRNIDFPDCCTVINNTLVYVFDFDNPTIRSCLSRDRNGFKKLINKSKMISTNDKESLSCFCTITLFIFESDDGIDLNKFGEYKDFMMSYVC